MPGFYGPFLLPHCGKRRKTNPHMRAFWAATLAFTFAFIGWFAFAPLMTVVRKDIGLCDNDAEVQLDIENANCICKKGCKQTLGNAQMASVSFDVFTRFMMGSVIETLGPKNADVIFLLFGALFCASGCFVTSGTGLIIARFFVSCLGSTFVVNQVWNTIMFSRAVVELQMRQQVVGATSVEASHRHCCPSSTGSSTTALGLNCIMHGVQQCSCLQPSFSS